MPQISKTKSTGGSVCFRIMSWDSQRKDFKRGEKPQERTLGVMTIGFRKGWPKYIYRLTKKFTWKLYDDWASGRLGSRGKVWNSRFKGRV